MTELVERYRQTDHRRRVAAHNEAAFEDARIWLGQHRSELILDVGCGTGQSTSILARQHPDARIIGLDKSAVRLDKHQATSADNYLLLRADARDFWYLARREDWRVDQLYLLYPNPYPKPRQVQRRWHASPAMPDLMAISARVEVRSNWRLYCQEFAHACALYGRRCELTSFTTDQPISAFEKKYLQAGQTCWRLQCRREPDTEVPQATIPA
ncbi:MAG: methyltransferase domain-containing protein [Pseudomonadota bacterium]